MRFRHHMGLALMFILIAAMIGLVCLGRTQCRRLPHTTLLEKHATLHPRLYLTAADIPDLREACLGTHLSAWKAVREWTDHHLHATPPTSLEGDFRRVGELIPYAALAYLVTEDTRYLQLAHRYMLAIARQPHWGNDVDIEAAHLLYGLAVGYDWLYPHTPAPDRALIEAALVRQASRMRTLCGKRHPALNNHRLVTLAALGTAALALYPDTPRAAEWIRYTHRQLQRTLNYYGSDGISCEGPSYWSHTTEYLLKYAALADALTGTQFLNTPWLRSAARGTMHQMLPINSWSATNLVMNLDDSPRFFWYGPHYQLFYLASRFRDPHAQWLGEQLLASGFTRHHADWLTLLWYDPDVDATPPAPDDLSLHAANWDVLLARGSWSGGETVCSFTCSPIGGHHQPHQWFRPYPGSGHAHPDANSFTIFGRGAWLAASPGDVTPKRTAHHNTLTFNGRGQLGEGQRWFDGRSALRQGSHPRMLDCRRTAVYDYAVGDATTAYPPSVGLKHFHRHFLYLRPDVFVILDSVVPRHHFATTWRLMTPGRVVRQSPSAALIARGQARLSVQRLLPRTTAPWTFSSRDLNSHYADSDWNHLNELSFRHQTTSPTCYLVVMRVSSPDTPPLAGRVLETADTLEVEIEDPHQGYYRIRWRRSEDKPPAMALGLVEHRLPAALTD